MDEFALSAEEHMQKAIDHLNYRFARVRTGRANANVLSDIMVDYYGVPTPITQVGAVKTPEAHLLVIEPWDKSVLGGIERALIASDLGVTPNNDGTVIRLPFPAPTEERRRELARECHDIAEEARIGVRNARRDANTAIDKAQKASELSEDEARTAKNHIQKLTDQFVERIDSLLKTKEAEVMEV